MITPRYLPRVVALLTLATTALPAQTTPVAAPPAAPSDQVVTLSEFQVSDKSTNSYIASETMSGSRVNTKIIDLPYSIVNLTSEFFQDFNIEVLDEDMTYIGGLTGLNIGGGFNLRGFAATSQLKDGFYRLGRYGLSNIDRIEVIRGPEAAIYGRSSPGGMVNFVSLQPKKVDEQSFSLSEGTFGQGKANLYLTGAIDQAAKTFYVVDLNQTDRGGPQGDDIFHIRNSEDFMAIEHDFSDSSHLKISGEYFLQVQHAPQTAAPIVSQARLATPDNTATSTVVGYDTALGFDNAYGPQSELNRGSGTLTLTYDKEFNDVWSTRFGAYRFGARRWDFNANTGWGGITVPVAGSTAAVTSTRGSLPSRGEIMEDGGGFQEDVSAHTWWFNHTVESNSLLTVDLNDYYRWDPTWEYGPSTDPALVAWSAASSGRVVTLSPGLAGGKLDYLPTAPLSYFPNWYNPAELSLFSGAGNSVTGGPALNGGTLTRRRTTSLGGNLREQALFLDGKLITYIGLRNDNVLFSQRDYTVAFASVGFGNTLAPGTGGANQVGGSVVRRYEHQNKPNMGFNYQVIPNLHLYGSYSTAYFVDQTSRPSVIASATYAPFTAKGYDYGIKGSYFDSKLNFTIGGYYDKEYNVLVSDTVEYAPGLFTDAAEQDGNQLVRGWETDVSWVVTNALTIGESFSGVNAKYTYFGSAFPEAIGRNAQNISPENGSVYAKYNIDHGALKGLYFNALATYVASTPTQAPNAGDTTTIVNGVSVVTAHTDAWKLQLPSFMIWNFGLHYTLPLANPKWKQTVSLNLNNAFNRYYLKTSALGGFGRAILVEYQISHF
jgi:iron complex outermembrane receptor protein